MGGGFGFARAIALALVWTTACLIDNPSYDAGEQADDGVENGTGGTSGGMTTMPNGSSSADADSTGTTGGPSVSSGPVTSDDEGPAETSVIFDLGGGGVSCTAFDPSPCPDGQGCKPIALQSEWVSTECVPLVPDPVELWGPCAFDDTTLGADNCNDGLVCFTPEGADFAGCTPLCIGDPEAPTCTGQGTACVLFGAALFGLCLPGCDPFNPGACAEGLGCYWSEQGVEEGQPGPALTCLPNAGADLTLYDECVAVNECGPGMACVSSSLVVECEGVGRCCVPLCDTMGPPLCPVPLGCHSVWVDGDPPPPPSLSHVGYCASSN